MTTTAEETVFVPFKKIPRLFRQMTITEKIDGTNASIYIEEGYSEIPNGITMRQTEDGKLYSIHAGSRSRWITPDNDNFGFAQWVMDNAEELMKLGEGHHFGEWWGSGIQRGYGLQERRFSLFNTNRWTPHDRPTYAIPNADPKAEQKFTEHPPACCHVVPVLFEGAFDTAFINSTLTVLGANGSEAATGFMKPEGVIVYHDAANQYFKVLLENDHEPKGKTNQ